MPEAEVQRAGETGLLHLWLKVFVMGKDCSFENSGKAIVANREPEEHRGSIGDRPTLAQFLAKGFRRVVSSARRRCHRFNRGYVIINTGLSHETY